MGLFVKKKDGNLGALIGEVSVGFDAIENHFKKLYPEKVNPKHFIPVVAWRFGGNDPLDEIEAYITNDYYHFVTYGLSELYEKKNDIKDVSGYGMEFTLKLRRDKSVSDNRLKLVAKTLQDIARITFTEGELFKEFEYIDFGENIYDSSIAGFITVIDPDAKIIDTKNGKVKFILLIGISKEELELIKKKKITVRELYLKTGDVTIYKK